MIPFFFVPGYWFVIKTERCKWKMKSNNDLRIEADMGRTTAPCCLLPFVLLYFSTWLSSRTLSQDTHTHTTPSKRTCVFEEGSHGPPLIFAPRGGRASTHLDTWHRNNHSSRWIDIISWPAIEWTRCPGQLPSARSIINAAWLLLFTPPPLAQARLLARLLLHVDRSSGQAKVEGEMPQSQS